MLSSIRLLTDNFQSYRVKRSFHFNVVVLASGTAISQALGILAGPFLSRLYTPASFGVLAIFTSLIAILSSIASLKYEMAIPLPKEEDDAVNITFFTGSIIAICTIFLSLLIGIAKNEIVQWATLTVLRPYLWLLPFGLFSAGIYQVLIYWRTRRKEFARLSYAKGTQVVGQLTVQILLALLIPSPLGLILGVISGQLVGSALLFYRPSWSVAQINSSKWKDLIIVYKNFPLFTSWAALIGAVSDSLPSLLLTHYFSLEVAGFFALALRMLTVPSALIGQAISQAFYPEVVSKLDNPGYTKVLIERVTTSLFFIALGIFSIVAIHGVDIFVLAFGGKWYNAGGYAQLMTFWLVFAFVGSPLSMFSIAKGKQMQNVIFSITDTTLGLTTIWLGAHQSSSLLAIGLLSVGNGILYITYVSWILHLAGSSLASWLGKIWLALIVYIPLILILFWMRTQLSLAYALPLSVVLLGLYTLWSWRKFAQ